MSELAQARAWIHLGLEKKSLSQHLKELLSNQKLLKSETKPRLQHCIYVFSHNFKRSNVSFLLS